METMRQIYNSAWEHILNGRPYPAFEVWLERKLKIVDKLLDL